MTIKEITKEDAADMFYDQLKHEYVEKGLFIAPDGEQFIGIDNSTGNLWVEKWDSREECEKWLRGEIDGHDEEDRS